VAAIRAGTGGVPALNSTTVIDDGVRDDLFSGFGPDWLFVGTNDHTHGHTAGDVIN
jgi:hypothetical protein